MHFWSEPKKRFYHIHEDSFAGYYFWNSIGEVLWRKRLYCQAGKKTSLELRDSSAKSLTQIPFDMAPPFRQVQVGWSSLLWLGGKMVIREEVTSEP
jgi:hypothetical protein